MEAVTGRWVPRWCSQRSSPSRRSKKDTAKSGLVLRRRAPRSGAGLFRKRHRHRAFPGSTHPRARRPWKATRYAPKARVTGCANIPPTPTWNKNLSVHTAIPDLPSTAHLHILVVGDVMLDRYWHGPADRVSPEAPVPVINVPGLDRPGVLTSRPLQPGTKTGAFTPPFPI